MHKPQIQILLSTYNGSSFLKEQLDSILGQTARNWQLLIRDDGSTDGTREIIQEYQTRFPDKMKLVSGGSGGDSSSSFMSMLPFAEAPYLMFCDQDDVWTAEKVETAFHEIVALEKQSPIALYFTDMKVVDKEMKKLEPSFFKQQKLKPEWSENPYFAFAQSMGAGCTMIFTQALVQQLHQIKTPLFQHDHWLLMHASFYGKVGFSAEKTVLYRQHESNAVGSHEINVAYFLAKITSVQKVFSRWVYIKKQFGSHISIVQLMRAKWKLNRERF